MKEKDKNQTDPGLGAPAEANRGKHINFREVEEESAKNFELNKNTSERQKQWREEMKEGEEEKGPSNSAMPLDEDDTVGIP